jgi:hypothetical protein
MPPGKPVLPGKPVSGKPVSGKPTPPDKPGFAGKS